MPLLFIFLLFISPLFAENLSRGKPVEKVYDKQENFPLTSNIHITPKVNVITGEYVEEECDLVVAGSEPLSLRRFYGHFSSQHPAYNFWRFNPEHFCAANFEYHEQPFFVSFGETNGNVTNCENRSENGKYTFKISSQSSLTYGEESGQHHPLNTSVTYRKTGIVPSEAYHGAEDFCWEGEIQDGSGRKRSFRTDRFGWLHYIRKRNRHSYDQEFYRITPNVWTPYQLPVREERLPNGNVIVYDYRKLSDSDDRTYPRFLILTSITAYNSSKLKKLGSLQFNYVDSAPDHRSSNLKGFEVIGSDGRKASYSFRDLDSTTKFLESATCSGLVRVDYGQEKRGTRLKNIARPNGREFLTDYNKDTGKVEAQYAHVGPNDELLPVSRYKYNVGATEVWDAEGNRTIYRFDDDKRITAVEVYDGNKIFRTERYKTDPKTGNLTLRTVEDGAGVICLKQTFDHDENQNVFKETLGDGKEAYTIYRTFSKDGFNLKLSETDDFGKKVHYSYVAGTNLLSSELTFEGDSIKKRVFHTYDDCATLTKTIIDDGNTMHQDDLKGVTFRRITEIKPRTQMPCLGLPECVEEKTIDRKGHEVLLSKVIYTYTNAGKVEQEDHYDSQNHLCYSIISHYDSNECLKEKIDALRHKTTFAYDANFNLTDIWGPRSDVHKQISYDRANRPRVIKERQLDGSYLVEKRDYDKCGRVIGSIDALNAKTTFVVDALGQIRKTIYADGSYTEKNYDALGNVIKEHDAKGFITLKRYNFRNQPVYISYPDGSEEHFEYNLKGEEICHTDRNGMKTKKRYDVFGHLYESSTYSPSGVCGKKCTAIWSAFHLLSSIDGEGIETIYEYDFAGRKTAEKISKRRIEYFYDALGRLYKTIQGDKVTIQEFDFLNRPIKTSVEVAGKLVREELVGYDELGHKNSIRSSKGEQKIAYDSRGRIVSQKNQLGHETTFTYAYKGCFSKTMRDPKGLEVTIMHDILGRPQEIVTRNALGHIVQRIEKKWDLNGNMIQETDHVFQETHLKKSITHTWDYGPCNQLKRSLEAGTKETLFTYDSKGRLETITKPKKNVIKHSYNDWGLLETFSGPDFNYQYTYDKNDRLRNVEDKLLKLLIKKDYDEYGQLIEEKIGDFKMGYKFDEWGHRRQVTLPDETVINYEYKGDDLYQVKRGKRTYTYLTRDLEGLIKEIELPSNCGRVSIEWDSLSRWKKFSSPYYKASFDKDSFDKTGNLLHYEFEDKLGVAQERYEYDELNQLRLENKHKYVSDSIFNRLEKDGLRHDVNSLCHVLSDGKVNYSYDLNGNMISNGSCIFDYDSQDRLTRVTKGDLKVEYGYDPFHRRIWKRIYEKGVLQAQEFYIHDGNREIGRINPDGELLELRVLGEGKGAEMGASVFYELNGVDYVPLHDFRGNVVAVIDSHGKVEGSYRYTAFGEEEVSGLKTPWRFASKRVDEETGLIFFGRRYYSPDLGRWMTADPLGYADGPNLYAYVHNNPLTHIDLYGLRDFTGRGIFTNAIRTISKHLTARDCTEKPTCHHFNSEFEKCLSNKSKVFHLGRPTLRYMGVGFTNGILTSEEVARFYGTYLSDLIGQTDVGIAYNATHGSVKDLEKCVKGLYFGEFTNSAIEIMNLWNGFFEKADPRAVFLHFCTSHGTIETRNALKHSAKDIRDRIIVVAIAPAAYIPDDLCLRARHYVSKRDFVPDFDRGGKAKCSHSTTILEPHKDAPLFDHSFASPTYVEPITSSFRYYFDKYGNPEDE